MTEPAVEAARGIDISDSDWQVAEDIDYRNRLEIAKLRAEVLR